MTTEIWDIERLHRNQANFSHPTEIDIDVVQELNGKGLPCLPVPVSGTDYESYLCVLPGELLYKLYERYGQRLLELNVRSFLSVTGKVNKGIRQTLKENPGHFFPLTTVLPLPPQRWNTTGPLRMVQPSARGLQIVEIAARPPLDSSGPPRGWPRFGGHVRASEAYGDQNRGGRRPLFRLGASDFAVCQ